MSKQTDESWKNEWQNMPEFVQEKQRPYAQIIVRFNSEEEVRGLPSLM